MYPERSIVRDVRVLTEQFIPTRILYREGQLYAIRDGMKSLLEGQGTRHMFVHGPPGTGKTCTARYVSGELESYSSDIVQSYNNCWENSSRFRILYNVLRDVTGSPFIHRKGTPTDEILDSIRRELETKKCVVILDEVDKIEDDLVLYDLSTMKNVCFLMIANSATALHAVDNRIRSRLLSAVNIEFPAYKTQEIAGILKDRAEWGLFPGAMKGAQVERIAQAAAGDCRAAIDMLRVASEEAERKGEERVSDETLTAALHSAGTFRRKESLGGLNSHQKLILEVVGGQESMDSGELFRKVLQLSEERGLEKIVDRTFRGYAEKLVKGSMIKASGTGRWRKFSPA
ncbi:MAG: AAA family ATPase [Candidatus Aenigmatarchaeota archaeon]